MRSLRGSMPDPLLRILVVFVLLIGAVLVIRAALPPDLIDNDLHVKATIEREIAREPRYAGSAVCSDCHDQSTVKDVGYHQTLSCETCHGTASKHAQSPTEFSPEAPGKREFCSLCHTYDPSRPTGFPQINPIAHNPLRPCISCHNPHDPRPPATPQECQACHAEIARTKLVSPHVLLECTTCHTAPDQHKVIPRMVRATIPSGREFCAQCHSLTSEVRNTPKVDFSSHGEKYLCWQCHYPHMPEAH